MIGQKLNNRFTITDRLGQGAMGEVFQAADEQTGQLVAVKILARQLTLHPESLERFRREAETLRQLDHPNIVKFVDAFEHDGQYIIVMEYVSGGNLRDLQQQGRPSIEHVRQIALDLCDALIRAHRLNIIHRDIKPENILLNQNGIPKLADFGVARLSEDTHITRSGTQVGTPHYMAPEAWEGKPLNAQADIWSLGVLLFEMLTGQVPFTGGTALVVMNKVFTSQPPDPKKLRTDMPLNLVKIIKRMLTRDKRRRYQTMREVAVDLERNQATPAKARRAAVPNFGFILIIGFLAAGLIFAVNRLLSPAAEPVATNVPLQETIILTVTTDLPAATEEQSPGIGSSMIGKDGATLMFVPEGEFTMGSDFNADEEPIHQVNLGAFWIDKTEVTNAMYANCVADGACKEPKKTSSNKHPVYYGNPEFDNYPMIHVDWNTANAYCSWAGRELPSEAQWEKAARGTDRRAYPWGNQVPNANLLNYNNDLGDTTEVGNYPDGASIFGALDMAGNVYEWVSSLYQSYPYDANDGRENLTSLEPRVLRGGAWSFNGNYVRSANRIRSNPTNSSDNRYGFRCALPF
jgi:eukaryotic-like serine/threonine-protein kinase